MNLRKIIDTILLGNAPKPGFGEAAIWRRGIEKRHIKNAVLLRDFPHQDSVLQRG